MPVCVFDSLGRCHRRDRRDSANSANSARPRLVPGTPAVPCDLCLPPDWRLQKEPATNGPAATGWLSLKAGSRLWRFVQLAERCLDLCVAAVVHNSTTGTLPCFALVSPFIPTSCFPRWCSQKSVSIQTTNRPAPSSGKALAITRL